MAFEFDTTESAGSKGPWVGWKSAGSAKYGIPPKSFCIRGKDEHGNSTTEVFGAFAKGVCIDCDSIKQGFMKDNGKGQAPERRFDVRLRPDDSKMQTQAGPRFCWSNAFTCRIAFTGADGQQATATWEDAGFGSYEGFRRLMVMVKEQMKARELAGAPVTGQAPVVVLTGTEEKSLAGGDSATPIFAIKTWVPTPPIFAAESGAAAFLTAPSASPAARLTPAPQSARAAPAPAPTPAYAGLDDDVPF